jgi:hypothetical protein
MHYDPNKKLVLATDASKYGIGAVLSHIEFNGDERPISFASRSLTIHEEGYSNIEKHGLAVVYGVTHFQKYLLGRFFELQTDHKPLT